MEVTESTQKKGVFLISSQSRSDEISDVIQSVSASLSFPGLLFRTSPQSYLTCSFICRGKAHHILWSKTAAWQRRNWFWSLASHQDKSDLSVTWVQHKPGPHWIRSSDHHRQYVCFALILRHWSLILSNSLSAVQTSLSPPATLALWEQLLHSSFSYLDTRKVRLIVESAGPRAESEIMSGCL